MNSNNVIIGFLVAIFILLLAMNYNTINRYEFHDRLTDDVYATIIFDKKDGVMHIKQLNMNTKEIGNYVQKLNSKGFITTITKEVQVK